VEGQGVVFFSSTLRFTGFASTTRFTKDHEWVRYDEGKAEMTLGITNFAQEALGDVVFVDLPSVGQEFKAGAAVAAVESVKAASDVYMPVNGKVTSVNPALANEPGKVNSAAEGEGYFLKFTATNAADASKLMDEKAYRALLATLKKKD
jgi:glycine cleavage system H protein